MDRSRWSRSFIVIVALNVAVFLWVNYLSVTWGVGRADAGRASGADGSAVADRGPAAGNTVPPAGASSDDAGTGSTGDRGSRADAEKGGGFAPDPARSVAAPAGPNIGASAAPGGPGAPVDDDTVRRWMEVLALSPEDPHGNFAPWMLFTHQLVHDNPWWFLIGMLVVWWLCGMLERAWRWPKVVAFYFVCGLGVCLCSLAVNAAYVGGSSGASLGMLLAVARIYGDEPRMFGRIRIITLFFFLLILMFAIGLSEGGASAVVGYWAQAGGALTALAFLKMEPVMGRWLAKSRIRARRRERMRKLDTNRRVDALLERIARSGMGSLSWSERAFLRKASKLFKSPPRA
ncbi:MAG: rhomboid family intramembrane serine protease [Planctomycetota bacterium]|nr:rhomboid family intramembrane serine protease [Planctomycetota bacterium]